jgi:hypothetical protein
MTRLPASKLKELGHKPSKYRNKKIVVDGEAFDSKREYAVYCELKLLQRAGEVVEIERQPSFELQPAFRHGMANHRAIVYRADFRVTYRDGRQEVIDVKSTITAKNREYRMKVKLLLYKYPTLNFREVF